MRNSECGIRNSGNDGPGRSFRIPNSPSRFRLLPWLRLLRFPLVFTAIGDAWAVRMLGDDLAAGGRWGLPPPGSLAMLAGVSFGLFGLGMVLNDVIDARADAVKDPSKPIPSGAVSRRAAALFAVALAAGGLGLARFYGRPTFLIGLWAAMLIVLYDLGGKRAPMAGLLLLGLIRAVHSQISAAGSDLRWWVFVFLFTHVTFASWIAYQWEGKRPPISTVARWVLAFLVVLIDLAAVSYLTDRPGFEAVEGRLTLPLLAGLVFLGVLVWIVRSRRFATAEAKGQAAMRLGLIWLLVYDAAFLVSADRWAGAAAMAALLLLLLAASRWMARPASR